MENKIDPKLLRKVAGAFATGVTVVTAQKEDSDIQGMTANSFLSVSLDPPLVAFSVREPGSLMQHLKVGKAIGISILSDQQETISNYFASKNHPPIEIKFEEQANGAFTIDGSLAWYATEITEIIPAGDHFLIMCKVINLHRNEDGSPLLYYSGYQSLSPKKVV